MNKKWKIYDNKIIWYNNMKLWAKQNSLSIIYARCKKVVKMSVCAKRIVSLQSDYSLFVYNLQMKISWKWFIIKLRLKILDINWYCKWLHHYGEYALLKKLYVKVKFIAIYRTYNKYIKRNTVMYLDI